MFQKKAINVEELKEKIKRISEKSVTDFSIDDLENSKGAFFKIKIGILTNEQKKQLVNEIYNFIRENNIQVVFRLSEEKNETILYVAKNYAREIHYLFPSREILQEFVDSAIKNGHLSGRDYELYANPNMGVLAKVYNGKVVDATFLSGASISIPLSHGSFKLGNLERGGWIIPSTRSVHFAEIYKLYRDSFSSQNSPYPWSIFNLMGTAKISFKGLEKLHFRQFIYPGFIGEIPLGSEAGLLDDIYNQTTAGCLFVGEGSFYAIKKKGKYITGDDISLRKSDIGLLWKKGEIELEEIPIGTRLRMRSGEWATLSTDSYGNKIWLDENGYYVPFDSINFDWDSKDMPQIVWKPPEFGESRFINKDTAEKKIFIDNKSYYFVEKDESIKIIVYPDRYNILRNLKKNIVDDLEYKFKEVKLNENQINVINEIVKLSQLIPVSINLDIYKR